MAHMNRREWNRLALLGLVASATPSRLLSLPKPDSKVKGVQIGLQSYSFRDRSLDDLIKGMVEVGLSSCELWQGHVEPQDTKQPGYREDLRKWRLTTPLEHFKAIRAKFDAAGIDLYAYNLSFRDDFTDAEIERGFEMAKALGVAVLTASANTTTVPRVAPVAERYKILVGMHNHSRISSKEFATPDDLTKALEGPGNKYIAVNLDIGHFTAANFSPVEFLKAHHDRIVTLHIKDRKKDQGPAVPFGEGDTPVREVLSLLQRNRWPIPANIEYEYNGADSVAEVKRCFDYCRKALGG